MKRTGLARTTWLKPRAVRPGWAKARRTILLRDHYRCRHCHEWAADVHHVVKRSRFGKARQHEADAPDNLVALCRHCHEWTDKPYSQGRLVIRRHAGTFAFEVVYGTDKFAVRAAGV